MPQKDGGVADIGRVFPWIEYIFRVRERLYYSFSLYRL